MCIEIKVENTAIVNGVAKSVEYVIDYCDKKDSILDYGFGKLRNCKFLKDKDYNNIYILDTELQIERALRGNDLSVYKKVFSDKDSIPIDYFKCVLCSFVLNVVSEESVREHIVHQIYKSLSHGGYSIIEVRKDKGIKSNKHIEPYNDGFLVGKNTVKTFQKPFTKESISLLIEKNNLKIEKIINLNDSICVISRKE